MGDQVHMPLCTSEESKFRRERGDVSLQDTLAAILEDRGVSVSTVIDGAPITLFDGR
jgi:hypothetical protein